MSEIPIKIRTFAKLKKQLNPKLLIMKTKGLLLATAVVLLTSCSGKLGQLSSDNFKVNPNPLETEAGQVTATINGTFPEKFMKKKLLESERIILS